ncbi:hypothetical protein FQZ97_848110 [compost metagenome]
MALQVLVAELLAQVQLDDDLVVAQLKVADRLNTPRNQLVRRLPQSVGRWQRSDEGGRVVVRATQRQIGLSRRVRIVKSDGIDLDYEAVIGADANGVGQLFRRLRRRVDFGPVVAGKVVTLVGRALTNLDAPDRKQLCLDLVRPRLRYLVGLLQIIIGAALLGV